MGGGVPDETGKKGGRTSQHNNRTYVLICQGQDVEGNEKKNLLATNPEAV
jgi:hypothetical protein